MVKLRPFTSDPAVEELQTGLGLVHGNHVASAIETHEGEVSMRLDLADLLTLALLIDDLDILQRGRGVFFLLGPFQSLGPGLVAQPVADEVGITSVDQDGDLFQKAGHQTVVRFHPVTVEHEVAVNVKVARLIAVNFSTHCLAGLSLVQIFTDVAHALVTQVARVLTLATDIIGIQSSALVRANEGVVAINRRGNTKPRTFCVVARLDHRLATRQRVVHGLAGRLIQDSRVTTFATGHGAIVLVLSQWIGNTVADQDGLEVDVTLLVRQNLGGKNRNVMSSVRLSRDMEVLLRILRELLEEEGEQSINVLASSDRVTDGGATVGVSDIDRLVEENNRGVRVPGLFVVDRLDVLSNRARSQLQEQTGK